LDRDMARRRVERVSGLEDFLSVGVAECHLAAQDITPVRALAPIVWQPLHQRRSVDVLVEGGEVHGVALELVRPIGDRPELAALGRAVLGNLRHRLPSILSLAGRGYTGGGRAPPQRPPAPPRPPALFRA